MELHRQGDGGVDSLPAGRCGETWGEGGSQGGERGGRGGEGRGRPGRDNFEGEGVDGWGRHHLERLRRASIWRRKWRISRRNLSSLRRSMPSHSRRMVFRKAAK